MSKDRVLFGLAGLLAGIVIGFLFANSINRSTADMLAANSSFTDNVPMAGSPSNHPVANSGTVQPQGGALPQVTETIDRANQQPENFEAQIKAGDLYYKIQRFADAAKFYEKASQIKPSEVAPMIKLGNAYFDAEQYEPAEKWYLEALKKTPNDTSVRTDLGLTYYLRSPKDIDRAVKEFQAALAIEPNKEITLQNLALAYRDGGSDENYRSTLDRLRKVNPNNPLVLRSGDL